MCAAKDCPDGFTKTLLHGGQNVQDSRMAAANNDCLSLCPVQHHADFIGKRILFPLAATAQHETVRNLFKIMRALKIANQITTGLQFQKSITNPVFQSPFLHPGFIKTTSQVSSFHAVPGIFFLSTDMRMEY